MSSLKKIIAVTVTAVLASTLLATSANASTPKAPAEVKPNGACDRRGAVADYDGREYKCSISGARLKWKPTGASATGGAGTTSSVDAKFANVSGSLIIDGSSTVSPLTAVAAEAFQKISKARITVGVSGTGGGFEKFCRGETDISNASRPIKASEIALCEKNGIKYTEQIVANDALSVVIHPRNSWAACLTTAELKKIWEPNSKVTTWKQVRPSFPTTKIVLYGAGTDSGTFDYFTEVINGKAGASRVDYNPTEDDNVTVNGVRRAAGGLGYYGLSYYLENKDINKAVKIDSGAGCVDASAENVFNGTYKPLGRPLFIYIANASAKKEAMMPFLEYYGINLPTLAKKAQFIQLNATQKKAHDASYDALKKLA